MQSMDRYWTTEALAMSGGKYGEFERRVGVERRYSWNSANLFPLFSIHLAGQTEG